LNTEFGGNALRRDRGLFGSQSQASVMTLSGIRTWDRQSFFPARTWPLHDALVIMLEKVDQILIGTFCPNKIIWYRLVECYAESPPKWGEFALPHG